MVSKFNLDSLDRLVAPVEAADAIFQRERAVPPSPVGATLAPPMQYGGLIQLHCQHARCVGNGRLLSTAAQLPDDALSKQFLLAFVDALSCRNGSTELTAVFLFWNAITEPGRSCGH